MNKNKAVITKIQRMSVDDGPGIRSTVFLKGCPLKCKWCHNPENISYRPQIQYIKSRCKHCGICIEVCPSGCYSAVGEELVHKWDSCILCKKCTNECYFNALEIEGIEMDINSVVSEAIKDRKFFDESGGGVTISGGEPLTQPDFCVELLSELKRQGVSTAVDTCGFVPWTNLEMTIPYTDLYLYDIKAWSRDTHILCTGQSNELILDNLINLDKAGKRIFIRMPVVKGMNDNLEEMEKIAEFLEKFHGVELVEILPYHSFGIGKYEALGMEYEGSGFSAPDRENLRTIKKILDSSGKNITIKPSYI